MQKKNAMFYTTIGRGDHARFMILASMLCADFVEEAEAADDYAPDMRAFIESLKPPVFPSRSTPRWLNGGARSSRPAAASATAHMARTLPTRTWSSRWT